MKLSQQVWTSVKAVLILIESILLKHMSVYYRQLFSRIPHGFQNGIRLNTAGVM